ncbi:hypothetical protein B296_00057003, partial [Ensete ventricosum]
LYNRKVRSRHVKDDDLVLWKAEVSDSTHTRGKLTMNWEGPYPVIDTIRDGTYRLATMERKSLLRK